MSRIEVQTLSSTKEKGRNLDFENRLLASMDITGEKHVADAKRQFNEAFREAEKTIPTSTEDFYSHVIMKHLARQLRKAATQQKRDLGSMPVYGSLPIGQLNAMAIRVPKSSEHLILFQHGVFGFVNLMTKAVAASFWLKRTSPDGELSKFGRKIRHFERSWAKDDAPLRRFGEFLHAYLGLGDATLAVPYLIQAPFHLPALILRESFELFLFGHELGHILAGHLSKSHEVQHMLGKIEVESLEPSDWDMEFEADAIGMDLAIQAMLNIGCDFGISYCGIDMAFSAMEIVDLASSTLAHGEPKSAPSSKSHPRHAERRELLREHLRRRIGKKAAKKPIKFAETLEEVQHQMWQRIEPRFQMLHAEGERLSPIWSPWRST